jgi:L-amino acid N-acyltransferase YncA
MERLRTVVMGNSDYEISLATPNDVPAILNLQAQNLRSNGGALSVRFSGEWFEKAIAEMPIVVAHVDGNVVGYVVSTPLTAQAHEPIIQAMLRAYPGSTGPYNYGSIYVAENHRGRGLAVAMFKESRGQLPGREGCTFIRADNAISRKVHIKMGMQEVAEFSVNDNAYIVVAYQG